MNVCKVPDCPEPHYARGWCFRHYQRNYRGRPLEPMPRYRARRLPRIWKLRTG